MAVRITYAPRTVIKAVAEQIGNAGYSIANDMGVRETSVDFINDNLGTSKVIGILKEPPKASFSLLSDLLRRRAGERAEVVAKLCFDGSGATLKKKWVMTVGREERAAEMGELARNLSEKFGVGIKIVVESKSRPHYELTRAEYVNLCSSAFG
jgi:hypothetical protein